MTEKHENSLSLTQLGDPRELDHSEVLSPKDMLKPRLVTSGHCGRNQTLNPTDPKSCSEPYHGFKTAYSTLINDVALQLERGFELSNSLSISENSLESLHRKIALVKRQIAEHKQQKDHH